MWPSINHMYWTFFLISYWASLDEPMLLIVNHNWSPWGSTIVTPCNSHYDKESIMNDWCLLNETCGWAPCLETPSQSLWHIFGTCLAARLWEIPNNVPCNLSTSFDRSLFNPWFESNPWRTMPGLASPAPTNLGPPPTKIGAAGEVLSPARWLAKRHQYMNVLFFYQSISGTSQSIANSGAPLVSWP